MAKLTLGVSLLLCSSLHAATFHVDPVAGSDQGDGSAANPWRSLSRVLDDGLVETRRWPSLPYSSGMTLVPWNQGAPVRAGDTILLHDGDHGDVTIRLHYNSAPITIAAAPGSTPRFHRLHLVSSQNWNLRGLAVRPSPGLERPPQLVDVVDHNWSGPTWDIHLDDMDIRTVDDASGWTPHDWVNNASTGIRLGASRLSLGNSRIRNVRFGIVVSAPDVTVRHNVVDGFSADGIRGIADRGLFEYNLVMNCKIGGDDDGNHDDGFQSWSNGPGGVGTGSVDDVVLRGNVFIGSVDPADPLRGSMQGIGLFDGFFDNWIIENNLVITDHWHGIALYGARNSRIVNNTVIDPVPGAPGPLWIRVNPHKNGTPSENVVVRNNLAMSFVLSGINLVNDHNLQFTHANAASLFVAPPYDLRLRADSPAIDAGSAELAPTHDALGVPRPQGAGIDLGAYEYRGDAIFDNGFEAG